MNSQNESEGLQFDISITDTPVVAKVYGSIDIINRTKYEFCGNTADLMEMLSELCAELVCTLPEEYREEFCRNLHVTIDEYSKEADRIKRSKSRETNRS